MDYYFSLIVFERNTHTWSISVNESFFSPANCPSDHSPWVWAAFFEYFATIFLEQYEILPESRIFKIFPRQCENSKSFSVFRLIVLQYNLFYKGLCNKFCYCCKQPGTNVIAKLCKWPEFSSHLDKNKIEPETEQKTCTKLLFTFKFILQTRTLTIQLERLERFSTKGRKYQVQSCSGLHYYASWLA